MSCESFFQRPRQGDQREGHDRRRQNRVREQNSEIDRAYPTLAFKRHGADFVVVDEIRNQKKARAREGRKHARFVRFNALRLDEKKSENQKRGAERVQRRIQRGQVRDGDQRGKISGVSIKIRNTQRMNGHSAMSAKVRGSNLRCMK